MRTALWVACASGLGVASGAFAAKPVVPEYGLMRGVSQAPALVTRADGQYAADGRVVALFQPEFRAHKADAETMAREFLAAQRPHVPVGECDVRSAKGARVPIADARVRQATSVAGRSSSGTDLHSAEARREGR